MKKAALNLIIVCLAGVIHSQSPGDTIFLNGIWEYDQTEDAFPPAKYTRHCPFPGLIHLA